MRNYLILVCFVCLLPFSLEAQPLTVWPGDANNNGECNHVDLLHVGLNAGQTGSSRNQPSIVWSPQQAQGWPQTNAINLAHSDCDGNGVIDRTDVLAVRGNFGLLAGGVLQTPDQNTLGGPASPILLIDIVPDTVLVQGTTTLTANLSLGTPSNPLDSLYGIAFTIDYDPGIVDQLSLNLNGGWLNDDSTAVIVSDVDSTLGKIRIGITRFDHANRVGYGTIGAVTIVMDDNIRVSGNWNLIFETSFVAAYTASASPVLIVPSNDTLTVLTSYEGERDIQLLMGPNPADNYLKINSPAQKLDHIKLYDMNGRVVFDQSEYIFENTLISTEQFPAGCYFLEVHAENSLLRKKLIIQHD